MHHLVGVFLDKGSLPDDVREVLGGHEARLEVAVQDVEALMLLSPEIVTEINCHFYPVPSVFVLLSIILMNSTQRTS